MHGGGGEAEVRQPEIPGKHENAGARQEEGARRAGPCKNGCL